MKVIPVIMAGGSGTRLWPLSRAMFPKQFLNIASHQSMLQETVCRTKDLDCGRSIFLCNEDHRFLVAEQLREIDHQGARILLEPAGRNTAPAIALAALDIVESQTDGLMLVMAADHKIADEDAFTQAVSNAAVAAEENNLVTFGVVPTTPETGYGYIRRGAAVEGMNYFRVDQFVEKPNEAIAKEYLKSGEYFWNSGMFIFKASVYLQELEKHAPEILASCKAAFAVKKEDLDFIRVGKAEFLACPDDSIDYALMEKTEHSVVVPMNAQWSDIGSWSALWEVDQKCENGNATNGDVLLEDTHDSLVHATSRLVATVGIKDVVVVETKDAVLVAAKDKVQNVKSVVNQLKQKDRSEFKFHREVYRPWGKYDSVDNGSRYQVKRITVKPGAKLSVQMHHHRAEHWIVVSGTALVKNGDREMLLTENQSTYIPVGVVHSLENPGKVNLEIIEVQSGSYLGEDDIVRLEDNYGRV